MNLKIEILRDNSRGSERGHGCLWLYTFFSKRSKRLCSFSWRKKKEPKEHPPNQAFPIWKDVIDYDGDPLRQGFGIALEPLPLRGSR